MIMACNTVHKIAPQIEAALQIPFLHIADVLGERLRAQGLSKVGLLATRYTVEQPFYAERLKRHGVEVVAPNRHDRLEVNRIITHELCFGKILDESLGKMEQIAGRLSERGADSVALACTEVGLLVTGPELSGLPVFDTTVVHCERTLALALTSALPSVPASA